jgi:hypothetical protein
MAAALASHGAGLCAALAKLAPGPLFLALGLCLVYRVVNAHGWSLVLRALGHPLRGITGARIWLTSESFRWLPGSVWNFGSRAVLATREGVPAPAAAASVVLELLLTIAAWTALAATGCGSFRDPLRHLTARAPAPAWLAVAAAGAVLGPLVLWALARRSPRLAARLDGLAGQLRALRQMRPDRTRLVAAWLYFVLMGLFNGLTLAVVLQAAPAGPSCPIIAVVAANALAWLVGFFAIVAPGGLVVREGCLAALLVAWMPMEQAVVVALAWRSVQVVAEIVCVAALAACTGLRRAPGSPAPNGAASR